MGGLVCIEQPEGEPVTLAEAKDHCRVDGSDEDTKIERLIVAARESAENFTERSFLPTGWKLYLDCWGGTEISIPRAPLTDIEGIVYVDTNGDEQTLSPNYYQVDEAKERGRVVLAPNKCWPSVQAGRINPIEIEFIAGYTDAASVPQGIKLGILQLVAHWLENPMPVVTGTIVSEIPMMIQNILWPFRVKER